MHRAHCPHVTQDVPFGQLVPPDLPHPWKVLGPLQAPRAVPIARPWAPVPLDHEHVSPAQAPQQPSPEGKDPAGLIPTLYPEIGGEEGLAHEHQCLLAPEAEGEPGTPRLLQQAQEQSRWNWSSAS